MIPRSSFILLQIALALAAGVLLRFVVDLHPVWWLVWLAPAPLLLIAIQFRPRDARWMVALAAVIGTSCNFHYYRMVMPLPFVILAIVAQALLWNFLIFASRRVIVRYRAWWTVFAYPVFCVAVDTLMAALLPDGNWGSLAYSQAIACPSSRSPLSSALPDLLFLSALVPSGSRRGRRLWPLAASRLDRLCAHGNSARCHFDFWLRPPAAARHRR